MQSRVLAGGSSGITAVQRSQEKTQNNGLPKSLGLFP